jgi:hypothetical protein
MDEGLEAVLAAQRLSDAVYDLFLNELGSTMEQAEAAACNRAVMKNFSTSPGGAVLKFQDKAIMRHDQGAPVKAFLKATRLDFLLPAEVADPVKSLAIPQDILAAAKANNLTAKAQLFTLVHGSKPKSAEASTLATVNALIAGTALTEPVLDNQLTPEDQARARRSAATTAHDSAANPWGATAWSITKQGEVLRMLQKAHGEAEGLKRAEQIAAAANSRIGATRPAKVTA